MARIPTPKILPAFGERISALAWSFPRQFNPVMFYRAAPAPLPGVLALCHNVIYHQVLARACAGLWLGTLIHLPLVLLMPFHSVLQRWAPSLFRVSAARETDQKMWLLGEGVQIVADFSIGPAG